MKHHQHNFKSLLNLSYFLSLLFFPPPPSVFPTPAQELLSQPDLEVVESSGLTRSAVHAAKTKAAALIAPKPLKVWCTVIFFLTSAISNT